MDSNNFQESARQPSGQKSGKNFHPNGMSGWLLLAVFLLICAGLAGGYYLGTKRFKFYSQSQKNVVTPITNQPTSTEALNTFFMPPVSNFGPVTSWKTYSTTTYGFQIDYPAKIDTGDANIMFYTPPSSQQKEQTIDNVIPIYDVDFYYNKNNNTEPGNNIFSFDVTILRGKLSKDFVNQYISKNLLLPNDQGYLNYWGEDASFWGQYSIKEMTINNLPSPAYELWYSMGSPNISDALGKVYFISNPGKNLVFSIGLVSSPTDTIENWLLLDKIAYSFKLLK